MSITSIVQAIGQTLCISLLGVHDYSGCDTVSAFAGRGTDVLTLTVVTNAGAHRATRSPHRTFVFVKKVLE